MTPAIPALAPSLTSQKYSLLEAAQAAKVSGLSMPESAPYLYQAYPATTAYDMATALTQVWTTEANRTSIAQALSSCAKPNGTPAYTQQEIADVTRFGYPTIDRFEIHDTELICTASPTYISEISWQTSGAESASLIDMRINPPDGQVVCQQVEGSYTVDRTFTYSWRLSCPGIKPAVKNLKTR